MKGSLFKSELYAPEQPVRRFYPERLDLAEDLTLAFYQKSAEVARSLAKGNYDSARINAKFTKNEWLAKLRVAAKYGITHPRDFVPLATDFVRKMNSLLEEVTAVGHDLSSSDSLELTL